MKVNFTKQTLYTLIIGMCVGVVIILAILVLTGDAPWLRAAGIGTGAPDVNARYLDGYGTSLSAAADKIYISDGSNYLPDNTVDTGAIVNGTITTTDISSSAGITGTQLANGACLSEIADNDGAGSGLDADLVDGMDASYFLMNTNCECVSASCHAAGCTATANCSAGKKITAVLILDGYMQDDCSCNSAWDEYSNGSKVAAVLGKTSASQVEQSSYNYANVVVICCGP